MQFCCEPLYFYLCAVRSKLFAVHTRPIRLLLTPQFDTVFGCVLLAGVCPDCLVRQYHGDRGEKKVKIENLRTKIGKRTR